MKAISYLITNNWSINSALQTEWQKQKNTVEKQSCEKKSIFTQRRLDIKLTATFSLTL